MKACDTKTILAMIALLIAALFLSMRRPHLHHVRPGRN